MDHRQLGNNPEIGITSLLPTNLPQPAFSASLLDSTLPVRHVRVLKPKAITHRSPCLATRYCLGCLASLFACAWSSSRVHRLVRYLRSVVGDWPKTGNVSTKARITVNPEVTQNRVMSGLPTNHVSRFLHQCTLRSGRPAMSNRA